jgi:integrase/recombinase XerC
MAAEDLIKLFLTHMRSESAEDSSRETYEYWLNRADKELPAGLDIATEDELKTWLWRDNNRGQSYAPASRALMHASLTQFFEWAVEYDYLDFDPMRRVARPKVPVGAPRVATENQARLLLTDAKQPYRLFAQLAGYASLRCIEIWRLTREDITEESIKILGKGSKHRPVPTHPLIWESVKDLPPGRITNLPSRQAVSNRFGRYCEERYKMRLTLHRMRGWFATEGYKVKKDPRALQVLLGHSNLATTTRYIAAALPQQQDIISSLPVFDEDDEPDAGQPAPSEPR